MGDRKEACLDKNTVRTVLQNLLSNAIKYSPDSSTINLIVTVDQDQVVFTISDRGIGIPTAEQGELFAPFYRAKNAENIPGTGLGLSIVKKAIEVHGGKIEMASQEGQGTTFRVTLFTHSPLI
ncbi:histidine kinase [Thalassoporum mexicanum PCC 7367]|uniref:sensor histidine kinase n=1 Tax=Thalassoporum mexicanum TaxID=3457544 RepID=UPI00029FC575|nr:sensor histidine kinase [Pseudanabaena sp. PCC 7367]AFY70682.1 histidine kinase [Pseudanabaena sp. PCC 7367]